MKTTMKQLATGTFIALLFLVINVKAEGTEKTVSIHESIEITLQLENWMIDETIWATNFISNAELAYETETSMKLENWMSNEKTWNVTLYFVEETEAAMELEEWMFSEKTWIAIDRNNDFKLTIETWMFDCNLWQ